LAQQLIEAIQKGDVEKTRVLLRAGAQVHGEHGFGRPLQEAINRNNAVIVRILVEAGAEVNGVGGPYPVPLQAAVEAGHVEMVRLLLSLGADVNGRGPGTSPLWYALLMYRMEIARVLIGAGADVKAEKAYAESHHMQHIVRALKQALGPMPPPMAVEEVIRRLEVRRDSFELVLGENFEGWDHADEDEKRAQSELASRLKARPQDTQTLLLWARLNWAGRGTGSPPTPEEALDRVFAAEPHNAEALYYKGRTYGGPVAAGLRTTKRYDLNQAVSFLRQAVEFAPKNLKYRKTLALFLADQGHPGEAKTVLRAARKGDPMLQLLEDLASVSIPEGAEFLFSHPLSDAMTINLADSGIGGYVRLRLRIYRISRSRAEIEAFYAARMPGFRFIPEEEDPPSEQNAEGEFGRWHDQFLRVNSGAPRPSRDRGEIPRKNEPGIRMFLVEMQNDPELQRKLGPGEYNCYLILVNLRK
jgi:tetratricopeptide (TPR) repeat protein